MSKRIKIDMPVRVNVPHPMIPPEPQCADGHAYRSEYSELNDAVRAELLKQGYDSVEAFTRPVTYAWTQSVVSGAHGISLLMKSSDGFRVVAFAEFLESYWFVMMGGALQFVKCATIEEAKDVMLKLAGL